MGTGDFTYELWANRQGVNVDNPTNVLTLFDTRTSEPSVTPALYWQDDAFQYYVSGSIRISSTSTFPLGTWNHVAIVRSSGVTKMYVNGVQEGSTYTDTNNYVGTVTRVGGRHAAVSGDYRAWNGYISNLRIVKGTALYTSNFTPSTTPLTAISGTSLLTCQSNSFKDNSSNNFNITKNGDTKVKSMNPFQNNTGKSLYFDGTGDYLTSPFSLALCQWWTGDFTIETWIYPNTLTGWQYDSGVVINSTLVGCASTSTVTNYWSFGPLQTGVVKFYYYSGASQ
jgi:hypothetical protein